MVTKSEVKYIQSLSHKKFRDEEGVFVAEGPRIVDEFLEEGRIQPLRIYAEPAWIARQAPDRVAALQGILQELKESELARLSFLTTPHQVLAVFRKPEAAPFAAGGLSLLLDGIQDPGNLGTIIRCADWFGVEQLICSRETADLFSPKVVQASMGSVSRVRAIYTELVGFLDQFPDEPVYAAALEGDDLYSSPRGARGLLMIGREGRGLSDELLAKASRRLRIPGKGGAESLNAAVATGILLSWLT